jgi:hypothetical protein
MYKVLRSVTIPQIASPAAILQPNPSCAMWCREVQSRRARESTHGRGASAGERGGDRGIENLAPQSSSCTLTSKPFGADSFLPRYACVCVCVYGPTTDQPL